MLYQTGAKAFLYAVVSPEGELEVRQTHEVSATRPTLKAKEDGGIAVVGGLRRVTLGDLPIVSVVGTGGGKGEVAPVRKRDVR